MSSNLPIYPLLREGRNVDVIVCFDASADIRQENWLSVADDYAKQRSIKGWPFGTGWPKQETGADETKMELDAADPGTAQGEAMKIAETREEQRDGRRVSDYPAEQASKSKDDKLYGSDLGFCNVWVGTTMQGSHDEELPRSKRVEPHDEWLLSKPDSGTTVVYCPFVSNPKVGGVDPSTSAFMSTWNFVYSPEEIDKVVALARANFDEGKEQMRRTVRAVYERKKAKRLDQEEKGTIKNWERQF